MSELPRKGIIQCSHGRKSHSPYIQVKLEHLNTSKTYPIGATSKKINLTLSRAFTSSSKPTYSHVIALVGRIAQATAATTKAHFLETKEPLLENLKQGQKYRETSVRTVSKLFDSVREKQ